MTGKTHTSADEKLIKKLFEVDPLDWARYPNGTLAFIRPDGSKITCTQEQLISIQAKQKSATNPKPKSTPMPKSSKKSTKTTTAAASPASQGEAGAPPASAANAAAAAPED